MISTPAFSQEQARCRLEDRLHRAAEPRMPAPRRRHSVAQGLRRVADRIDN